VSQSMLRRECREGVAWLRIDRPEKLNAMLPGFWAELRGAMHEIEQDEHVRVVVIHGAGRCFSVGGDIEGFGELRDVGERRSYVAEALSTLRAVEEMRKPTIAAVHGLALGGGCELTMVCDIVVADATARFGMPEASVGLMPGLGVVRGRAHLGLHALKYLVLTGETFDAEQAMAAGLVNVVTEQEGHVAEAQRLAGRVAGRSPLALSVAKRILSRGHEEGYDYAVESVSLLMGSADHAEGIAAFVDKREPRFTGG
jgi:enoyl-CoA hydratase